ncbi:MAG TPA: hypothetical protein VGJ29_10890 [Vicinamibacterales bacterium]|jgi:hypothetical protein
MATTSAIRTASPSYQAYEILHIAFTVAPLVAGVDKFFHFLVNWDQYLSPLVSQTLHVAPHTFMLGVGVIEIIAGLVVAFMPVIGAWIVGLWLCGIIVNLLSIPGYFDVALRDLGLALGAFALARLATEFDRQTVV